MEQALETARGKASGHSSESAQALEKATEMASESEIALRSVPALELGLERASKRTSGAASAKGTRL